MKLEPGIVRHRRNREGSTASEISEHQVLLETSDPRPLSTGRPTAVFTLKHLWELSRDDIIEKVHRTRLNIERRIAEREGKWYWPPLFKFDDLPSFLQDNEFIYTGYRVSYSFRDSWQSIFMWHNETGNIWSHMIGFFFFVGLLAVAHRQLPADVHLGDYVMLAAYASSAAACFLFSTLFHTHFCNSKTAYIKFGCLDYAGISTLICGSCCVVTYCGFYCLPLTRNIWLTITVFMASVGVVGPFFPIWSHRSFRKGRVLIYLLSGLASTLPVFHYLISHGFPRTLDMNVYYLLLLNISLYLLGASLYAYRIPESIWPGRFDYLFHSHQLWHVAVLSACYLHYLAAVKLLHWRSHAGTCE